MVGLIVFDTVFVSQYTYRYRPTKYKVTPEPVPSLQPLMVASLWVAMFLLMPRQHESCFAKAAAMNELPRFKIRQVGYFSRMTYPRYMTHAILDCPEREATYVITNGGINDPDKV